MKTMLPNTYILKVKVLLTCVFIFCMSLVCFSQDCPTSHLRLETQTDVDAFAAMYPNCTNIEERITIGGSDLPTITDLSPLAQLVRVGGNLSINSTVDLESLNGLENIAAIDGNLTIRDNQRLTGLLENWQLDSVKSVTIDNNLLLENLSLGKVKVIEGNLTITEGHFSALTGLDSITMVKGSLLIKDNLSLSSDFGLQNLVEVEGELNIENHPQLAALFQFPNLTSIGEDLIIKNSSISSLNGMIVLKEINGDLNISGHQNLHESAAFISLESIAGDLLLSYNENLSLVTGFNKLKHVEGNIFWPSKNQLEVISGFNSLDTLRQSMNFILYNELTKIKGFSSLEHIEGWFRIKECEKLDSLIGFDALKTIDGDMEFEELNASYFSDFPSLEQINGTLGVRKLDQKSISSFPNLKTINGILSISNNPGLESVVGFNSLTEIHNSMYFEDNDQLNIIEGFEALDTFQYNLQIRDNEQLKNIRGFSSLISANIIDLDRNRMVEEIPNFNNLKYVYEDLYLHSLDSLVFLTGFEKLDTAGNININFMDALLSMDGFPSLKSANIQIRQNDQLKSIEGFDIWEFGSIQVTNHILLDSITDFEKADSLISISFLSNDILSYLPSFENVRHVEYVSVQHNNALTDINSLNNLEEISGRVLITYNDELINFNCFDNVQLIAGEFIFEHNEKIEELNTLNECTSIGALRIASNNEMWVLSSFNKLQQVDDFKISNCSELFEIDPFVNLAEIDGTFNYRSLYQLKSINGFGNLERITGDFKLDFNHRVEEIKGFGNLKSISGEFYMQTTDSLETLNSFSSLESVGESIVITSNEKLQSILNMPIKEIHGSLRLHNNKVLQDISAFRSLNPQFLGEVGSLFDDVSIVNNSTLSQCNIESICRALALENKSFTFSGNSTGCNSEEQISCDEGIANGFVFYDKNENGIFDIDENGISNMIIQVEPDSYELFSNSEGLFLVSNQSANTYDVNIDLPSAWSLSTDSTSYHIPADFMNDYPLIFGVIPNEDYQEVIINLSSDPTRCNTEINAQIRYENRGNLTETLRLDLHLDEDVDIVSAFPTQDMQQGKTLSWNVEKEPFEVTEVDLVLQMPNEQLTGKVLAFDLILLDPANISDTIARYHYDPTVLCSYDPNDKLVSPAGESDEHYTLKGEDLNYTVRFQNTGNAEAIDVKIIDVLDPNLDLNTFKVVNSSFPVLTNLSDRSISFYFKDINLPDSTSNEALSHGFVTYRISPFTDLAKNTIIENTAAIYFDFNPAIITNTTFNNLVSFLPTNTDEYLSNHISLFPNPTNAKVYLASEVLIDQIILFDLEGRKILNFDAFPIDLKGIRSGIYVLGIHTKEGIRYQKILKR